VGGVGYHVLEHLALIIMIIRRCDPAKIPRVKAWLEKRGLWDKADDLDAIAQVREKEPHITHKRALEYPKIDLLTHCLSLGARKEPHITHKRALQYPKRELLAHCPGSGARVRGSEHET